MKKAILLLILVMTMSTSAFATTETKTVPKIDPDDTTTYSLGIYGGDEYFLTHLNISKVDLKLYQAKRYTTYKYPTRQIVSDNVVSRNYSHIEGYIVYTEIREQRIRETIYQSKEVIGINKKGDYGVFSIPLSPHYNYYTLSNTQTQRYKLSN